MRKKLGILFVIGFLLRLISLNQSLWLDEAITAQVIRKYSFFQIAPVFSPLDFHPPFYYLFMKIWAGIFGSSEIALRMPSVLLSVATGYAVYLIGSRLKNERVGFWAALLYLFNPLVIYYAQEARMYSMVTCFLAFATYFYLVLRDIAVPHPHVTMYHLKALQRKDLLFIGTKRLLRHFRLRSPRQVSAFEQVELIMLFSLFLTLGLWTFYGSAFYIAALFLLMVLDKQYRRLVITAGIVFFLSVPLLSLLAAQLSHARIALTEVINWKSVLGGVTLKNILLIPVKFAAGRISFDPKWLYYFSCALWTLLIFSLAVWGLKKRRDMTLLLTVPLIIGFIVSFVSPMLQYFRFLYLVPLVSVALALGMDRLEERKQFMAVVSAGLVFFSLLYLVYPQFHREDWRALARSLPQDKTVYMILPSSDALLYYAPHTPLKELRQIGHEWLYERSFYIIPYTSDIYGFDYKSTLYKSGCFPTKRHSVRGIFMEVWDCGKIG